uniref:Zinc finger matrin-type protein 5 n=1 Tax=Strigamia maritima TaxID=126957 RepID=T1J6K3_STRMM
MGKRYYCDYCERSFADHAEGRKKHLNGVQHQRLRKQHYDRFRDAANILAEELPKKPCKRFGQTGQCDFGTACRFSHLTYDDIQRLRKQVDIDRFHRSNSLSSSLTGSALLNSWLTKRAERLATTKSSTSENPASALNWTLPNHLQSVPNLPVSVMPPSVLDFSEENVSTWG